MTTRYLNIHMRVAVEDLSEEKIKEYTEDAELEPDEVITVDKMEASDPADIIMGLMSYEEQADWWAGSDLYGKFAGATVISASFEE